MKATAGDAGPLSTVDLLRQSSLFSFSLPLSRAGQAAQQARTCYAFAGDLSLVPGTQEVNHSCL